MFEKYLNSTIILYGEENPDYVLNNAAVSYKNIRNYKIALKLYTNCLDISTIIIVGIKHVDTLSYFNDIALIWKSMGKYSNALESCTQCYRSIVRNHVIVRKY